MSSQWLQSLFGLFNTGVNAAGGLTQTCRMSSGKVAVVNCIGTKDSATRYREVVIINGQVAYGSYIVCKTPSFPTALDCKFMISNAY